MTRVLVIDDEPPVRQMVRKSLDKLGYEVSEATDGATALKLLGEEAIDLVITDLYMPNMDGIEFTIRLAQKSPRPGLIAISGGGFMEKGSLLETARRLGADATLDKPFSVQELLDTVTAVLQRGDTT